ncbi:MAG: hypothetical protein ABSB52_07660 [Acidimicrobiales bacterium]|jgi:hypothetical protein
MKRRTIATLAVTAVAVLVPLAVVQVASAGTSNGKQQRQAGSITIQSWLDAAPSENVLSGTVWDCFKITGVINDAGGGPTWDNDTEYHAPNSMTSGGVAAASQECNDKVPAGGFILVPPPAAGQYQFAQYTSSPGSPGGLSTVYATHTIAGRQGDIFISFSGTYNMTNSVVPVKLANGTTVQVQPLTTGPQCTWLITGGTGAYSGLQGSGTCFANAEDTFPWINHTENGQVWWQG